MSDALYYLRGTTIVEPLIHHWYAWPLLVAPHTAAMISRNLHAELLHSYVDNPDLHISASQNPRLRGGPYVNHSGDLAPMKAFLDQWTEDTASLVALAKDIHQAQEEFQAAAGGMSMQALYARLPASLQGRTELVYDLNDQPGFRFIEALFYGSGEHGARSQQFNFIDGRFNRERPFMLSTPRIPGPHNLIVRMAFADPAIDAIHNSRRHGIPAGELHAIADRLFDDPAERTFFLEQFHQVPPVRRAPIDKPAPGTLRVRYFGHACVLVEHGDTTVLVDPLVSDGNDDFDVERYTLDDLPESIDYVVFTHAHQDHVVFETLLAIRHRVKHFVMPRNGGGALQDPSLRRILAEAGFDNLIELDELQPLPIPGGMITGLPFYGEHGDLDIRTKMAWHFRFGNSSVVCAGDSNNLDPALYERLRERVGEPDLVFIGMECVGAPMSWLYGPLFTRQIERRQDQARRLDGSNAERALKLIDSLKPAAAFVYALGAEPWLGFISSTSYDESSPAMVESAAFVAACRDKGLTSERLYGRRSIQLREGDIMPELS